MMLLTQKVTPQVIHAITIFDKRQSVIQISTFYEKSESIFKGVIRVP